MRHATIIAAQQKVIAQILADNNFKLMPNHPAGPRVRYMTRVDGEMTAGDREHFGDLVDVWLDAANYLRVVGNVWQGGAT